MMTSSTEGFPWPRCLLRENSVSVCVYICNVCPIVCVYVCVFVSDSIRLNCLCMCVYVHTICTLWITTSCPHRCHTHILALLNGRTLSLSFPISKHTLAVQQYCVVLYIQWPANSLIAPHTRGCYFLSQIIYIVYRLMFMVWIGFFSLFIYIYI